MTVNKQRHRTSAMETRSAKRKRLLDAALATKKSKCHNEDWISSLPDDILYHILFFLPIKSIAQTSVLSKRWRHLWYSFPDLDFTTINPSISHTPKGADFITQVLSLREKHSYIRVLKLRAFLSFSGLNDLIRRAIKHNVQELDVEVSTCDYFNFPRSVINSESLRVFRLKSGSRGFRLPPSRIMKAGFRSLTSLFLSRVFLKEEPSLVNLFTDSSFPSLKTLQLEACIELKHLKINCRGLECLFLESCQQLEGLDVCVPKLEKLSVSNCFYVHGRDSWIKIDTPSLKIIVWSCNVITKECVLCNLNSVREAYVGFYLLHEDLTSSMKLASVYNFLSGVSRCQSLTLENQCIEFLSKSNYRVALCPFNKLKSLELYTGFNRQNNPALARLFKSSPILDTITIRIISNHYGERKQWNRDLWEWSNSGEEKYWESQTQSLKTFLHHLKVVKIHGFSESANDISLIKFLLKNGKVLEELFLCMSLSKSRDSLQREKIKSQILGFSRASSNAKIVFL